MTDRWLQSAIRNAINTLLDGRTVEAALARNQEVEAYEKGLHPGPTRDNFAIQGFGKNKTAWNRRAAQIVVEQLVSTHASPCEDREHVIDRILTRFGTMKRPLEEARIDLRAFGKSATKTRRPC